MLSKIIAPLAASALLLVACGGEAGDAPAASDTRDDAAQGAETTSADEPAMTASLSAEGADQAFRCNALFVAAVTGRISGQRALPADLDAQVRPMGQAWWQEREQAAIAALGLSEEEATARAAAEGERVYGRRDLSEEDITDLRACVAAMS